MVDISTNCATYYFTTRKRKVTGKKKKHQADNANLYTGYCANFSGNWNNGDNAGPFQFNVNYTASNSNSNLGTHQMFSTLTVLCDGVISPFRPWSRGGALT